MNTQSESVAWEPYRVLLDYNSVEDVGYDLLDRDQQRNYATLKDSEQKSMAQKSAYDADVIIKKLMKGAK